MRSAAVAAARRFFRKTIVKRMEKHHALLTPAQVSLLPGGAAGVVAKIKAYDAALRTNQVLLSGDGWYVQG